MAELRSLGTLLAEKLVAALGKENVEVYHAVVVTANVGGVDAVKRNGDRNPGRTEAQGNSLRACHGDRGPSPFPAWGLKKEDIKVHDGQR